MCARFYLSGKVPGKWEREMSEFMKFAKSQLVALKEDAENAEAKVVELKSRNESVAVVEAAEKVAIDRFARWQAVSNLIYNAEAKKFVDDHFKIVVVN
jgi:hypothetical protein